MDRELWVFVLHEIQSLGQDKARTWQRLLCGLVSQVLRSGMPMEKLEPRPTFHEESRQARNAEEALLAVLNACAQTTRELSRIEWPRAEADGAVSATAFGTWLKRLQGQRPGPVNVLAMDCLSFLDLSGQYLAFADLWRADLGEAYLEKVGLEGANLQQANLAGANLAGANLVGANMVHAYLMNAHLERANLEGANLESAKGLPGQ